MSTINVTNIKHPSSSTNNIVLNSDGTCALNGGGKVVQVKMYMTNTATRRTTNGYIWGGGNGGASAAIERITISPVDTSNRIILACSLAFGRANLNGGIKWLINGADDTSTRWMAQASGAYLGGETSYRQAFNTADDGITTTQDYTIVHSGVTLITDSSYTLPSTMDFGLYWYENVDGWVNLNRQETDNGGRAVSSVIIYEVEG